MDHAWGSTTLCMFWQTSSGTLCHPPIVYIETTVLMASKDSCSQNFIWKTDIEVDEVDYLREITPPFFEILNAGRLHEEGILALAFLHLVELIRGGHWASDWIGTDDRLVPSMQGALLISFGRHCDWWRHSMFSHFLYSLLVWVHHHLIAVNAWLGYLQIRLLDHIELT